MQDRDNALTMLIETSIDLKQKVLRIDYKAQNSLNGLNAGE